MVGWNHQFNGHEPGQTLGDGEGQGGLRYCSPWCCRVGCDLVTEQQQRCLIRGSLLRTWVYLQLLPFLTFVI